MLAFANGPRRGQFGDGAVTRLVSLGRQIAKVVRKAVRIIAIRVGGGVSWSGLLGPCPPPQDRSHGGQSQEFSSIIHSRLPVWDRRPRLSLSKPGTNCRSRRW